MRSPGSRQLLEWGTRRLRAAGLYYGHGTASARDEAAWLLAAALETPADQPIAVLPSVPEAACLRYQSLIEDRIRSRRPAAYLLSEAWFAGRRYFVDERTLIPRSLIGEFIGERFAPWVRRPRQITSMLDIGTGSGCIALALAHAFPWANVDASDVSRDALAVAAINVRRQRLGRRVRLVHSDLFKGLAGTRYNLIVSNPPYATERELRALPDEYRHEPRLALVAPGRGLAIILQILAQAPAHLHEGGVLVVETGNRAPDLSRLLAAIPFVWLQDSLGDGSVFLLERSALLPHRALINEAVAALRPENQSARGRTPVHKRR